MRPLTGFPFLDWFLQENSLPPLRGGEPVDYFCYRSWDALLERGNDVY